MDFAAWIKRAAEFIRRLRQTENDESEFGPKFAKAGAPISSRDLMRLQTRLRHPLPPSLQSFLTTAAGGFEYHYGLISSRAMMRRLKNTWIGAQDLHGGVLLCEASRLVKWQELCAEGPYGAWNPDDPEAPLWLNSIPFAHIACGDFLALDIRQGRDRCPVVYLCHDDEHRTMAPTFEEFLLVWERLGYLGPEWWLLDPFRDPESGYLNADTKKAQALRKVLGIPA